MQKLSLNLRSHTTFLYVGATYCISSYRSQSASAATPDLTVLLIMMSATNSVRSLATESYNTAAKKFVTRDFKECWDLLKPLSEKCLTLVKSEELSVRTRSKLWVLYAALVDAADFQIQLTWDTLLQGYETLGDVEPSVMLAVSQVLMKTPANGKKTAAAIEEYLSHKQSLQESDRPLLALLVTEILPGLGDFEYAREFTENCSVFDAQTKTQIKSGIDKQEAEVKAAIERAEQERLELERQEKERVKSAIDSAIQEEEEGEVGNAIAVKSHSKPQVQRQPVLPRKKLPEIWKEWIIKSIKSRTFTNALLFIIFLLTLASNVRVRHKLAAGGRWVWEGAKQAAKMAVTVTYF